MRAAIYNPYLDTLGGGERYTLSLAKVLLDSGFKVDLEWKDIKIVDQLQKRFNLSLGGINVISSIDRGDGYDLCFWVSDGSIPALKARKNILHFQIPFHDIGGSSLINKMKLFRINKIICNSHFTKGIIDKEFKVNSTVIYPPVDINAIKPKRKENTILNVGRFSGLLQSKRQDILIKTFQKICDTGQRDWKLILVGGNEVGDLGFSDTLKRMSQSYPIEIILSPDFGTIKDLYGRSKIFWSASGYEVNEDLNPEKVEHFGISIVEAMAGGCVPVVYNAGGHKEIINDTSVGILWTKDEDLLLETNKLIKDSKLIRSYSQNAVQRSEVFSFENFKSNVQKLL